MILRTGGRETWSDMGGGPYTDLARFFSKTGPSMPSQDLVKKRTHRSLIKMWPRRQPLSTHKGDKVGLLVS